MNHTDLFIIGGGINGTGIAADAANRGLSTILCEQGDLACGTSSKSSHLIHGGLRYLDYYQFRLVKESLEERSVLLKRAPHLVSPLSFILPYNQQLKPKWMIKLGLFLYDHLSHQNILPASHAICFKQHPAGKLIQNHFTQGFSYTDCLVDDARLVIHNAIAAQKSGATIRTRTRFLSAKRRDHHWEICVEDVRTGEKEYISAAALVNAAGPWVDDVLCNKLQLSASPQMQLVKGSHIIVPRLYKEDFAFTLSTTDHRIVFIIPYLQKYSLIGTTEILYRGNPNDAHISAAEITYLCDVVNKYLIKPISYEHIVSTYAGVRPLYDEKTTHASPSSITRDYKLILDACDHQPPLLSIFGGKITTYRKLSEKALGLLQPFFKNMKQRSTRDIPLPGGGFDNLDAYIKKISHLYPFLPFSLIQRWVKSYGTHVEKFLENVASLSDLGVHIGENLYEREVLYLMANEWAETAEDILWRRTKLGLSFSEKDMAQLEMMILNLRKRSAAPLSWSL
ncbi:MAG: aerobic glycerol-3-phosphate dehydrogenase [Gammaproteobacteria bacterium]|nr:aerobic glycerol-3-phosphate dehydrogenase [Gammaproteobacteria bacterium]